MQKTAFDQDLIEIQQYNASNTFASSFFLGLLGLVGLLSVVIALS